MPHFHLIDGNHRRRAQVARELMSRGIHVEIYEDLDEFEREGRKSGIILAKNDKDGCLPEKIQKRDIGIPVVLYSERPSVQEIVDAVSAGAVDFLEWPFTAPLLDGLIRRLETIAGRKAADIRKRADAHVRVKRLSIRERQVLVLMVQGGSSKSIGEDLCISHRTVEIHRANLMTKLGAQSSADVVRIAVYAGVDEALELTPQMSVGGSDF